MIKNGDADGLFDDGLAYLFKDEDMNPQAVQPYHIHVEINTGTLDLETCDIRLYRVEESDMTEEQMNTETVCEVPDEFAQGGGPNIEGEGANPESDPGSPTRSLGGGGDGNNESNDDEDGDADNQTTPAGDSGDNPENTTDANEDDNSQDGDNDS